MRTLSALVFFTLLVLVLGSCKQKQRGPSKDSIAGLALKSGDLISCGAPGREFGTVVFDLKGSESLKQEFNAAVELLHSFEYDESEKAFARIIEQWPDCAMAYWGVAMCNFHPLWEPPTEANLIKGSKAIGIAKSIAGVSVREKEYIDAVAAYYENWTETDPKTRALHFEKAMEALYMAYPSDNETAVFYALSLDAAADPTDKTFSRQKKAGDILNALYQKEPNHPGIIHYIIHTYDYPGLATQALEAARRYATVAPSSAHALHMPSHIFTRLGLWDDCIRSNQQSVDAAKCYASSSGISGHWDEELHGLDYLVYAYLQKGDNEKALELVRYIDSISVVVPLNAKCAYTFAASPARYVLENKKWKEAAVLALHQDFPWKNFPWQESIVHFARLLGNVHIQNKEAAGAALKQLEENHRRLLEQKQVYQAKQVAIQVKAGEAWILFMQNKKQEALQAMEMAALMEDSTSKHPVTPGEVLPARELYAEMLMEMHVYEKARLQYETALVKSPNRFNSLWGAARAAEASGDDKAAKTYYHQLLMIMDPASGRTESNLVRRKG